MITLKIKPGAFRITQYSVETPAHLSNVVNWRVVMQSHSWRPPTDIYETEDRFVVRLEIAGMKESDFSIDIDQNFLQINGIRPDISEKRAFHQMEIHFGEFRVEIEIPGAIEIDQSHAEYHDGFLWVTMPKSTAKQIPITQKE